MGNVASGRRGLRNPSLPSESGITPIPPRDLQPPSPVSMRYPDETLSFSQLGLREFVELAQNLQEDPDMITFTHFMCSGRTIVEDLGEVRVTVNCRQGADPPRDGEYQLRRDFDSAIGITRDLPFSTALAVFPMPSFADTLKRSNHVNFDIKQSEVSSAKLGYLLSLAVDDKQYF